MSDSDEHKPAAPARRTRIFISYRREDAVGYAEQLYELLKRHFAERHLFLDSKSLLPGENFLGGIEAALASCTVVIAVISRHWLEAESNGQRRLDDPSDLVRREISAALGRGVKVIPLLMHGVRMPGEQDLPHDLKPLAQKQAVEIRPGDFEADAGKLVRSLKRELFRKRRLVAALLTAAALLAASILLYHLATTPVPVALKPGGDNVAVPAVRYPGQELVIEGLIVPAPGGTLLKYDGQPVADVLAVFEGAKIGANSVAILQLNPRWKDDWTHVTYSTVTAGSEDEEFESRQDFKRACATSIQVAAADAANPPSEIRLFQQRPEPRSYRELVMQADRDLVARLKVQPPPEPGGGGRDGEGPGCLKELRYDREKSGARSEDVDVVVQRGKSLRFRFIMMDREGTSKRAGLMRFDETGFVETFALGGGTSLRARGVTLRLSAGGKTLFNARSASDEQPLHISGLKLGPDSLRFDVEGQAYVTTSDGESSAGLLSRIRARPTEAVLLLLLSLASLPFAYLTYTNLRL